MSTSYQPRHIHLRAPPYRAHASEGVSEHERQPLEHGVVYQVAALLRLLLLRLLVERTGGGGGGGGTTNIKKSGGRVVVGPAPGSYPLEVLPRGVGHAHPRCRGASQESGFKLKARFSSSVG